MIKAQKNTLYFTVYFTNLLSHYAIMILKQAWYLQLPPYATESASLRLPALSLNHYATQYFIFWTIFKLNSSSQPQLA